MGRTLSEVLHELEFHPIKDDSQRLAYEQLRAGAIDFATLVGDLCPPTAARTTAWARLRESLMWAIGSIACDDDQPPF